MAVAARVETTLEHHPSMPASARRFLRDALRRWDTGELVAETAVLVADELVTNVLLHTSSGVTVAAELRPSTLRVEVSDDSPDPPAVRSYGRDALTGRGLALVGMLTVAWGVEVRGPGKTVWADVALREEDADPSPTSPEDLDPDRELDEPEGELRDVCLMNVPIATFLAVQRHNDALVREFALVAINIAQSPERDHTPSRLRDLIAEARSGFARPRDTFRRQIEAAVRAGDERLDLSARVPPSSPAALGRYVELLEEAETYIARGDLLTPPPSQEVVGFRRWLLGEAKAQIEEGRSPQPYSG